MFFQPTKYSSTLDSCIIWGVNDFENIRIMTQTYVGIIGLVKNGIMLVVRTKFVMLTVITTLDR